MKKHLHTLYQLVYRHQPMVVLMLLAAVIAFAYKDLFGVYFLNDEWLQVSKIYIHGLGAGITDKTLVDIMLGKGRPVGTFLYNLYFTVFGLQTTPFVITFLFLHILNSYLCFSLARRISNNMHIAAITAVFFAVSPRTEQTMSWIGAGVQTLSSTTIMLGSLLLVLKYLSTQKMRYLGIVFAMLYIGFLIKEQTAFMFLFVPLMLVVVTGVEKKSFDFLRRYGVIMILLFVIAIQPLFYRYFSSQSLSALFASEIFQRSVFNMAYIPFVGIGQFFLPFRFMDRVTHWFLAFAYPFMSNDSNAESIEHMILSDEFSILATLAVLFILGIVFLTNKGMRKTIGYSLLVYLFSIIPLSVVLFRRGSSYIDSRYVYFTAFSIGLMFSVVLMGAKQWIAEIRILKPFALILVMGIALVFFLKSSLITRREVRVTVLQGQDIKHAMEALWSYNKSIPKNPIFYITGDREYYYPNNYLPFQLGTGFMVMTAYYPRGVIPGELVDMQYLWQFSSQGYKEISGRGFGYFWDKQELLRQFQTNPDLSANQLVGMHYDSDRKAFEDRTEEIRRLIVREEKQ